MHGKIQPNPGLEKLLIARASRKRSGVIVVSTLTSPYPTYTKNGKKITQRFSCKHDCFFCPQEKKKVTVEKKGSTQEKWVDAMPRSYLRHEPACQRANRADFEPIKQVDDRLSSYYINSLPIDKLEVIVLGGTCTEYPREYMEEYVRDLFYAANTFPSSRNRKPLSLVEEHRINETSSSRIIGLTLEMRPDSITMEEIAWMRYLGVTRVQIGVQHVDDAILKKNNRGCYTVDTIRALKLLYESSFKVIGHLMPDLPGSSPECDKQMFQRVLDDPDICLDEVKLYPTATTSYETEDTKVFSMIHTWFQEGSYMPYAEQDLELLIDVLLYFKKRIHPWIRIARCIRDIPEYYVKGGIKMTNLRQVLHQRLDLQDERCDCIRCREVKDRETDHSLARLRVSPYTSSDGQEYFLEYVDPTGNILYGFLRLRLDNMLQHPTLPELNGVAKIRELHVYGEVVPVNQKKKQTLISQHSGYGTRLLQHAENLAIQHRYDKIAVISGIGTRGYYRKKGYNLHTHYMVKHLLTPISLKQKMLLWLLSCYFIGIIVLPYILKLN